MTAVIDRFRGDAGRDNLIDALMEQAIAGGNRDIAKEFADRLDLVAVAGGDDDRAYGVRHLFVPGASLAVSPPGGRDQKGV